MGNVLAKNSYTRNTNQKNHMKIHFMGQIIDSNNEVIYTEIGGPTLVGAFYEEYENIYMLHNDENYAGDRPKDLLRPYQGKKKTYHQSWITSLKVENRYKENGITHLVLSPNTNITLTEKEEKIITSWTKNTPEITKL